MSNQPSGSKRSWLTRLAQVSFAEEPAILSQVNLDSYIKPANKFNQASMAKKIGAKGGIGAAVSLQWILNCVEPGAGSPEGELQKMKGNGSAHVRHFSSVQNMYDARKEEMNALDALNEAINLMSNIDTRFIPNGDPATDWRRLHEGLLPSLSRSTSSPKSCVLALRSEDGGAHIMAATHDQSNGELQIFDPDHGLITVEPDAAEDIMEYLWEQYKTLHGVVLPIGSLPEIDLDSYIAEANEFNQAAVAREIEADGRLGAAVTLAWVKNSVERVDTPLSPEEHLERMKRSGAPYFKQLFDALKEQVGALQKRPWQVSAAMQNIMGTMSKGGTEIIQNEEAAPTWETLHGQLSASLPKSSSSPKSCLLVLDVGELPRVMIGVNRDESRGTLQIFDPDHGIFETGQNDVAQDDDEKIIHYLWNFHGTSSGLVLPITSNDDPGSHLPPDVDLESHIDAKDRFKQFEVAGVDPGPGFCATLSMQWILNSIAPGAASSQEELRKMKTLESSYFEKLSQISKMYGDNRQFGKLVEDNSRASTAKAASVEMDTLLQLMSKKEVGIISCNDYDLTWQELREHLLAGLSQSTSTPRSCLLGCLYSIRGGHLMGVTQEDGQIRIFDPNRGLITFQEDEAEKMIHFLWRADQTEAASVYPVKSMKNR